jgi:GntR family transcriptional repressor for pyruvate dehydrogenase complex
MQAKPCTMARKIAAPMPAPRPSQAEPVTAAVAPAAKPDLASWQPTNLVAKKVSTVIARNRDRVEAGGAVSDRKPFFDAKPAVPARLADAVSDAIAAALFDGRIAPGEALPPEGEIAREFGVSKPIAREALRQLTAAGLIVTQQGKVARAKALNGESLERIYGYAVRSSLPRLLDDRKQLNRIVAESAPADL